MQLPRALQPWSASLELLAPELRWPMGSLVQRLASVIGPLAVAHSAWDGEPDGFDGLERRGPYERLLVTEWLLADELPMEFIRRAAMNEHAFLRLARPEPAGDRLSVALFDAGPEQLGAPRLVQLALLILLARRAEAAHARFGWGIVQRPHDPLVNGLDEVAVNRLFGARTADPVSPEHVAAWRDLCRAWPRLEECWWIGGTSLAPMVPGRTSRVTVDDVLEPGARKVQAQISIPGRLPATVPLELPSDGDCTRLVRDPFGRAMVLVKPEATTLRPLSNLVFSADGRKLFARLGSRGVVSYPIPNSPRQPAGNPKVYETYGNAVAVARVERTLVAAVSEPNGIDIRVFGHAPLTPTVASYLDRSGRFRMDDHLTTLWPRRDLTLQAHLLDANGALYALENHEGRRQLLLVASKVLGITRWRDALLVADEPDDWTGVRLSRVDTKLLPLEFLAEAAQRVLFGRLEGQEDPTRGPLAVNTLGREWSMRTASGQWTLIAPEGTEVCAVGEVQGHEDIGLTVVESDRKAVTVLGRNWEHGLARASAPIEHVTVEPALGLMAYATRDELVVSRLDTRVVLLRLPLA